MNKCKYICSKCPFDDCTFDGVTLEEIKRQDDFDEKILPTEPEILKKREYMKRYNSSEKGKVRREKYRKSENGRKAQSKYNHSDKKKIAVKRYQQTDKGKLSRERYLQSEKGQAMLKRKNEKRKENGKNAEYCRQYRLRKKEELEKLKGSV